MNFRISSEAREDLVSVWEYSREHWGIEQADLYIDAFMLRFVWLTRNRDLWRPRPDLEEGVFSCIEKSHVIFFRCSLCVSEHVSSEPTLEALGQQSTLQSTANFEQLPGRVQYAV